jgi:excisionase family DNA binding protein
MEKLFTVAETAALLGVGRNKVYELISARRLASVKIGRCRRIPASAVERYVAELSEPDSAA